MKYFNIGVTIGLYFYFNQECLRIYVRNQGLVKFLGTRSENTLYEPGPHL